MRPPDFSARSNAVLLFFVAVLLTVSACGGSDDTTPTLQAGDQIVTELAAGGQVIVTTTYKVYELEPGDGREALLLLPESRTVNSQALRARPMSWIAEEEMLQGNISHVMSFLHSHWDAHINGVSDEGVNSYELVRYLEKHKLAVAPFLREFDLAHAAGFNVQQFVSALDSVASNLETDSPGGLLDFLHHTGKNLKELSDSTGKCYSTWSAFLQAMNSHQLGFHALLDRYKKNGDDICVSIVSGGRQGSVHILRDAANGTATTPAAASGLEVSKFVWQVIKDNAPEAPDSGAFTSVLNNRDLNPFNYEYARDSSGEEMTWTGTNIFGGKAWNVKFNINSKYGASHREFGGHYIPSIHFTISDADVWWPWKLNAQVHMSSVSNVASAADPNPEVTLEIDFNAKGILQATHETFNFKVTGLTGIAK
jgi:hypothetical protein